MIDFYLIVILVILMFSAIPIAGVIAYVWLVFFDKSLEEK